MVVILRSASDPRRAASEKRYLKSELEHFGVPVPQIRAVATAFVRDHRDASRAEILDVVGALWAEPIHEVRTLALELLVAYSPLLRPADARLVERLIRESRTWALVDTLAVMVAGDLAERYDDLGRALDRWAADDDFWMRRAAMLALLKPLRRGEGDFDRFARYADAMLEESEFFIRKAIGWILRETSKKRPGLVYGWVLPRASRASGVTLREAVKYLPAADRARIEEASVSRARSRPPSSGSRRPAL